MPAELQTAVIVSLLPVEEKVVEPDNELFVLYNISQIQEFVAIWNNTVAKFTHNITWDATPTAVNSGSRAVIPSTPSIGWSYDGLIRDVTNESALHYSSDVQAHFSLDAGVVNIQNWYPRSQIVGYPGGEYDYTNYN